MSGMDLAPGCFGCPRRYGIPSAINDDTDLTTLPLPSERRLSNITPLPRQAFLLLSLEGFSEEEVAFILGT